MPADRIPLGKRVRTIDRELLWRSAIHAPWNEPFCTVLPKGKGDPIGVSREQLPAKPDGLPS
jgi:hypothetical protein